MSQTIPFADKLTVVNLDVSIWAGRAKVRPEDLPQNVLSELPPSEVATLGTKRLFPLDALRPFNALKMRAYTLLCQHGTRFLGGFAVDRAYIGSIEPKLVDIKADFDAAVSKFLSIYDEGVRNWQAAFPQWSAVLAAATPTAVEVAGKFRFAYQIYTIAPAGACDCLADDMSALPSSALEDVASDVRVLLRETYTDGRSKLTDKSLNPLRGLLDKVNALSFLNTDFSALHGVLFNAVSAVRHDPDGPAVPALRALLVALSDAASVHRIAADIASGDSSIDDIWDSMYPDPLPTPTTPELSEPMSTTPELSELMPTPTTLELSEPMPPTPEPQTQATMIIARLLEEF